MTLATLTTIRWELQVTFAGYDTNIKYGERTQTFELVAADYAAAAAARDAFLTDLGAITEATIIGSRLTEVEGTADAVATTAVTLNKLTVVTLRSGTSFSKKLTTNIVCPADAVLANGKTLIATNSIVTDWVANFMSAGAIRISDGEYVATTEPIIESRSKIVPSGKSY